MFDNFNFLISLIILLSLLSLLAIIVNIILWRKIKIVKSSSNIVNQIENSGEIEEEDRAMLKSVFEFGDTITREVMVPRTDMVTLESGETLENALKLFISSGFSRIPVLGESADEIVGIIYFKDVAMQLFELKTNPETSINDLVRTAQFVPESKPVDDLFRLMQKDRQHIALVIDEYGGIAGLVTLEDALEEIVGELDDEHDAKTQKEIDVVTDAEGKTISAILPSRFSINDIEEMFCVEIEHEGVDTVLGLLNKLIGKVATKGSVAKCGNLELEALTTSGRRKLISTIKVTKCDEYDGKNEK